MTVEDFFRCRSCGCNPDELAQLRAENERLINKISQFIDGEDSGYVDKLRTALAESEAQIAVINDLYRKVRDEKYGIEYNLAKCQAREAEGASLLRESILYVEFVEALPDYILLDASLLKKAINDYLIGKHDPAFAGIVLIPQAELDALREVAKLCRKFLFRYPEITRALAKLDRAKEGKP